MTRQTIEATIQQELDRHTKEDLLSTVSWLLLNCQVPTTKNPIPEEVRQIMLFANHLNKMALEVLKVALDAADTGCGDVTIQ